MRFPAYLSTEDYRDSRWWFRRKGLHPDLIYLGERICKVFAKIGIPLYVCQYLDDGRSFGLAHCVYMDDMPDACKRMVVHIVNDAARTVNLNVSVDDELLVVTVDDLAEDAGLFLMDEGHFWKQDRNYKWYDTRRSSD